MSTHSVIILEEKNGKARGIYCHCDGYPGNQAPLLLKYYSEEKLVRKLINLGSLSSLGQSIGSKHNWDNPPEGECNAYHRDRDEELNIYKADSWRGIYQTWAEHIEYVYLFRCTTKEWYFCRLSDSDNLIKLADIDAKSGRRKMAHRGSSVKKKKEKIKAYLGTSEWCSGKSLKIYEWTRLISPYSSSGSAWAIATDIRSARMEILHVAQKECGVSTLERLKVELVKVKPIITCTFPRGNLNFGGG
jgi:hypothetical protein